MIVGNRDRENVEIKSAKCILLTMPVYYLIRNKICVSQLECTMNYGPEYYPCLTLPTLKLGIIGADQYVQSSVFDCQGAYFKAGIPINDSHALELPIKTELIFQPQL